MTNQVKNVCSTTLFFTGERIVFKNNDQSFNNCIDKHITVMNGLNKEHQNKENAEW